jgi:peptidoglycan glycosyltransferase
LNRQIRRVGYAILLLFGAVFLQLNWIQVVRANRLASDPRNVRLLLKEYSIPRGAILSADGQVLARSDATPAESLKFLRSYPLGALTAHPVGYYSVVFGAEAVESHYNGVLVGDVGVLTMRDLGDRLLGKGQRGDDIVLTLDTRIQQAAAKALGPRKGAVIALDPKTGDVLAMVSFPTFDPGSLSSHSTPAINKTWGALQADASKPLLDRAAGEAYPPGSTFKLVTASAALEHGKGADTAYPPTASYQAPQTDHKIGNFGGKSCGGDMAAALKASCNVYFARLGAELPGGALDETAKAFGFGTTPPLDVRAAISRIPSATDLRSPAFRAQAAIGQFDVAATPLQMALVAAGIAGGGQVPVPHLLQEVRDVRGEVVRRYEPSIWRQAISQQTAATLRDLMVSVVDSGTGTRAAIPGVRVAGKTGTAQTGRGGEAPHTWFVCFAPADAPRIAIAVVVENGGDLGSEATGGKVAAPIARAVLEADRAVAGW